MKILLIGAGKMGFSIVSSWNNSNVIKSVKLTIVEKSNIRILELKKKYKNIIFKKNIPQNWTGDLLILSIKPQVFFNISDEIVKKNIFAKNIISIMAGIKIKTLYKSIKFNTNIIRVMPNIASSIGLGVTCIYYEKKKKNKLLSKIKKLLEGLGNTYILKSENLLDSVTALSGSGPAYFFLFLLNLESIAMKMGFGKKLSKKIVFDTALGALQLTKDEYNIRKLIDDVSSQGGTTEAALKELEKKNNGLLEIMKKAVLAADKRSKQLSKVLS